MNAQDLKNSILQLAIQGKLVEQRKEEGTAEELYQQIQEEKARLIKEGKIKKEKPLAEITEDEIPFDIPESWKWVRLYDILNFIDYRGKTPNKIDRGIVLITASNIRKGYLDFSKEDFISKEEYLERQSRGITKKGDILFTTEAPLGNVAINTVEEVSCGQRVITFQQYGQNLSPNELICYFIQSPFFQKRLLENATGTTAKGIKAEKLKKMLLPIPPVEEQKRIVAKIEELMPYVDEYGETHSKLEEFNKKFPEDMQKSILQYAVQGKLVEQREEEGTAEELYQQIQEEKARLIKEGKIKKEKPLAEITEEEIPFDIPESWKWVRLGSLLNKLTDGAHSTPKYTASGVPFISVKDISGGKIDFSNTKYISEEEYESLYKRCNPERGDILLTKVGTTGIPVVVETDEAFSLFVSVALLKFDNNLIYKKYLLYAIKSPVVQIQCEQNTRGVGNKNWVMRDIANTILPLPPLEEQKRIVAKIDELLPYCQQLVK